MVLNGQLDGRLRDKQDTRPRKLEVQNLERDGLACTWMPERELLDVCPLGR